MKFKVEKMVSGFTKLWLGFYTSLSEAQRFFGTRSALVVLLLLAVGFCSFGSTSDYTQIEKAIKEGNLTAAR